MMPLQLQQCHHISNIPLPYTLLYCLALSSFFVCSLFAFVPSSVRRLPRDHVLHIKWRAGVVLGVTITGIGVYPWLFCQHIMNGNDAVIGAGGVLSSFVYHPWYRYLGFRITPLQDIQIGIHVLILYIGSLTDTWTKIYHYARILHREEEVRARINDGQSSSLRLSSPNSKKLPMVPKLKYLRQSLNRTWIQPTVQSLKSLHVDENHRWMMLRNLCIAPLAEEVIFRACLLPPLLVSRTTTSHGPLLTPTQASWIAPLFFGVAHLHHFYEKYRHLPPSQRTRKNIKNMLLIVAVQWTYTTLFGAYVSHVYVRTASLSGVTLAHVICNYMGLPDISFINPRSHPTLELQGYRWIIMIVYPLGIVLFAMGFNSVLFPRESMLPSLLPRGV